MQRFLAILCILGSIGISTAQAQSIQRSYGAGGTGGSPYGTSGYGASPYGSGTTYGGAQTPYGSQSNPAGTSFTGPSPSGTDNTAAPTATTNSADYQRIMNSVNSSTSDTDNPNGAATTGSTATPPVATAPDSVVTPPNESAYNSPLGAPVSGPTGASGLPGSNGMFTSPSGTTGLGEFNRSPYASGQATSSANPAPGPVTPVYTGTGTGQ